MSGFLWCLAVMSVAIALTCTLMPASAAQHTRLLCSLCVVALICTPILSLIAQIGSWEVPDQWIEQEQEQQDYEELAQELTVGQLQVLLERDMALPPDQCNIYVEQAEGRVQTVTLVLSGKMIWRDPAPIRAYVEQLLGCACIIVLD